MSWSGPHQGFKAGLPDALFWGLGLLGFPELLGFRVQDLGGLGLLGFRGLGSRVSRV